MGFYLGLEGGGTKTDLVIGTQSGAPLGRWRLGPTSLSRRSTAEVAEELRRGISAALTAVGGAEDECLAVCGGFASAGSRGAEFTAMLQEVCPRARVEALTDAELALEAATGGGDGIILIAGTGSIAWGRRGGKLARAGGEGPGRDPGSGDWIGRQAVAAGLVSPPGDGNFAGLLPRLARETDPRVVALFQAAGQALAELLRSCAATLDWAAPESYARGGVVDHIPEVRQALERAWGRPLLTPKALPAEAALARARRMV
ncbi:MAG TPA: BadF/BadG/BcrA/BcrD ATPase family protein [Terriglobales bacterium]|nr:BadF/BadG/BcrA/BcrD ATPase family protein [Terriglobales bacterium]